jgi:hypothetical protein
MKQVCSPNARDAVWLVIKIFHVSYIMWHQITWTPSHIIVTTSNAPYRMSQEKRSTLLEVIVSVILRKKCIIHRCVLFHTVSVTEQFHCTTPKLLIRQRYHILFLILVFTVQVTELENLPSIIHFQKVHRQHQCTLQLTWGHGMLLVCTVYCTVKQLYLRNSSE